MFSLISNTVRDLNLTGTLTVLHNLKKYIKLQLLDLKKKRQQQLASYVGLL